MTQSAGRTARCDRRQPQCLCPPDPTAASHRFASLASPSPIRGPSPAHSLRIHVRPDSALPLTGSWILGDTDQMMAEVEIWQDRISAVMVGQPVELATPLSCHVASRVDRIGLTVGRQGLISDDAAEKKGCARHPGLVVLDEASSDVAALHKSRGHRPY